MSDTCSNADFAGLQWNELSGRLYPCTGARLVMLNRDEIAASAQASTPSWHPRFRRWAARRARQFSIAILILTGIMVVGACGVMFRRATCLLGLPDVGDPFDVAAFRTFRVPEDQDAFALFRQAAGKLRPVPDLPMAVRQGGMTVAWSQADPGLRESLEANREALALFRQAALRLDGMAASPGNELRSSLTDLEYLHTDVHARSIERTGSAGSEPGYGNSDRRRVIAARSREVRLH